MNNLLLWEIDTEMADEETREYWREQRNKWNAEHLERARETNRKSQKKFIEKHMAENPEEFLEKRREVRRKSDKKYRENKLASMTPEELEAYKEKERARFREYRAKKKAEKLAQQKAEKEKSNE